MIRRAFMKISASAAVGSIAMSGLNSLIGGTKGKQQNSDTNRRKVRKSVKWGMVGAGESVLEKFQIQKELGYNGVEFVSPTNINLDEVVAASKATKMPVHGLVNMRHWKVRMSSPDDKQREQAVKIMKQCIADCKNIGGESVLLVPGRVAGENENHDHVWKRSIECIKQVLPVAEEAKISILIENVWNGFCKQPEELRDYIDEINHELVQVYFDIGNARKFAPSEKWVEVLGKRIKKLDVKGWSKANGFKSKIGDGDVNWPAVCKALDKIEYDGWCTAEVGGGGKERLAEIAQRLDKNLVG